MPKAASVAPDPVRIAMGEEEQLLDWIEREHE